MERKNSKKDFYFSFKNIKKIYLPIILTIFIIFNIPFIPNSLGNNDNMNFQPSSGSSEAYFFSSNHFKNKEKSNNDGSIAFFVFILILAIIFGIIYLIFYKFKDENGNKVEDRNDYMELLKDDSDFEGNI